MSYIVLARKFRPRNFDEVVGQEHITSILKNSIKHNRLAHAYLFTGPRGIGKTSCARIFAKSLNCAKGITLMPCDECSSCREISDGRSLDVIEIDGASNRGIDEIRTLRENVKFAPTAGNYKIYIIDEVHMLTTEAFNALLKTLEEPPDYVKFIFATTQPKKVISTIVSRCQRFDFRLIPTLKIIEKLEEIAKKEHLEAESDALFSIAKASGGSLRDAETILDQLSSYSLDKIKAHDVTTMLGMVEEESLFGITERILEKDTVKAIKQLDDLINSGKDPVQFLSDFLEHFRNLMLSRVGGKLLEGLLDLPDEMKKRIFEQSQKFSLPEILNIIERLIQIQDIARFSHSARIPIEMFLAQLTVSQSDTSLNENHYSYQVHSKKENISSQDKTNKPLFMSKAKKENIQETKLNLEANEPAHVKKETENPQNLIALQEINTGWPEVLSRISQKKMSVATYLQEGALKAIERNRLTICFPEESMFHKEFLEHKDNVQLIEKTLKDILNVDIKVLFIIVKSDQENKQEDEPLLKSALETFKGKVIGKWHRPE